MPPISLPSAPDTSSRSFFSSALLTYGTNLAVATISFANVLVVSRALGASGRGHYALLTTIAYLVSQAAALGIHQAAANVGAAEPARRPSLATNSLLLAVLLGATAAVAVGALVEIFPGVGAGSSARLRWLVLASLPVLVLQTCLILLVQSGNQFGISNLAWLVPSLVNVLANGFLALAGLLTVGAAIGAWVAGQVLSCALLVWFVSRRFGGWGRPDPRLARHMLSFGLKTHGGRLMTLGNYRLDQWLVGALAGTRELGLYSVAVAWSEALFFLPTAVATAQRPDLVRGREEVVRRHAAFAFRAALVLTALLAAVIVLAAPFLCATLFGEEFAGATDDLRVLALGGFGIVALKQLVDALTARGRPLRGAVAIGVAFVATITLDLVLIPSHGGLGAAVASATAYTLGGATVAVVFVRTLRGRASDLVPRGTELLDVWRALRDRLVHRPRTALHADQHAPRSPDPPRP